MTPIATLTQRAAPVATVAIGSARGGAVASGVGVFGQFLLGVCVAAGAALVLATGVPAAAAVGTATATGGGSSTASPTGVSASASIGTPIATGAAAIAPAGLPGSASLGSATGKGAAAAAPSGQSSAATLGPVAAVGQAITTPAGVSSTAALGTVTASGGVSGAGNASPAGVAVAAALGSVTATGAGQKAPSGLSATVTLGSAVAGGAGTKAVSGLASTAALGTSVATGAGAKAVTGLSATATLGTAVAGGAASKAVTGLSATATKGTPVATGAANKAAAGVSATAALGTAVASAAFDPLVDITWDQVWKAGTNTFVTGTTPATNGQSVENFADAIAGTANLTQATSGQRPVFTAADSAFNNKGSLTADRSNSTSMLWTRGSTLTPPYSVIIVGAQAAAVSDYQTFVGDSGEANMYVWQSYESPSASEAVYLDGATVAANALNTAANVWHVVASSTDAANRIGKNGLATIPPAFTPPDFHGLSLWRYPTADILHGGGKIAFVGVYAGDITAHAKWLSLLAWIQSHYGVQTNRTAIICDGDSRTNGYNFLTPLIQKELWCHVLQSAFTDAVTTVEIGVIGRTMVDQLTAAPTRLAPALAESPSSKKIVVAIDAAYNDVAGGASAATAYQAVCDYVRYIHGLPGGVKVLLGTSPRGTLGSGFESARLALNALVLANAGDGAGGGDSIADGVVDIAKDSDTTSANPFAFANNTTPHNPGNFNSDYIHFSAAGNAVVAGYVETALAASPFSVT